MASCLPTAAEDDATLVKHIGNSFRFSAIEVVPYPMLLRTTLHVWLSLILLVEFIYCHFRLEKRSKSKLLMTRPCLELQWVNYWVQPMMRLSWRTKSRRSHVMALWQQTYWVRRYFCIFCPSLYDDFWCFMGIW